MNAYYVTVSSVLLFTPSEVEILSTAPCYHTSLIYGLSSSGL
jgi:hypothetical protein